MKRSRHIKVMTIIILFISIIGLTIGFLAFSTTLIVEPIVDVRPNTINFKLVIYGYDYLKNSDPEKFNELSTSVSDPYRIIGASFANQAKIDNSTLSISNLHANFTRPGQSVSYAFIVRNEGDMVAYLNSINFNNIINSELKRQCISDVGNTNQLVSKACDDIELSVEIKGNEYYDTKNLTGNNIKLSKGEFFEFFVHIDYKQNGSMADDDFMVNFGDVLLDFSAVES